MEVILAIDIGTSSVKVAAINPKGELVNTFQTSYLTHYLKPNNLEQDPEDWWQATVKTVRAVMKAARLKPADVKAIGLSVDPLERHSEWEVDIAETQGYALNFPLLADADKRVANLYGMIHPESDPAVTVRSVFLIDPAKRIRLILIYPPSAGRNFAEIVRAFDSVQISDKESVSTPVNWEPGKPVIISPALSDAQAKDRFPQGWRELRPYLRIVDLRSQE